MFPSPVAPENQPIAAAVGIPPGGRATRSASWAVLAIDQPRPFSAIRVAYAATPHQLASVVSDLYGNRQQREQFGERARSVARPDAAAHIVARVLRRLDD